MMRRMLTALLATLALAACFYRSDVDLAPMADRPDRPVVAPGDYCEATASSPPYRVKSSADCERIAWDAASRSYIVMPSEEGEEPTRLAPVALGADLYLLQTDGGEGSGDGRYQATLVLAKDSAFFMLPTLDAEKIEALAARHPGVALAKADGKDPVVTGGDLAAIRAFLREAAIEALRAAKLEDEELSVAVRDRAGAADHEANGMQTMAIIELVTAVFALRDGE